MTLPQRVVVVGGDVAGLEALLGLHYLGDGRLLLELVSASRTSLLGARFTGSPADGAPVHVDLERLCEALGVQLHTGGHPVVDRFLHTVQLLSGVRLDYDELLIAGGASRVAPYAGVHVLDPRTLAAHLENLPAGRLSIVVPPGVGWTLPAYQLALLAVGDPAVVVEVISPERRPLELFGEHASDLVSELLDRAGVVVLPPARVPEGSDLFALLDNVISLPVLRGPGIAGLPRDGEGFLPVDALGRVTGTTGVHAVGDAVRRVVQEDGLAGQDAGIAAEDITRHADAVAATEGTVRVLRGQLAALDGTTVHLHRRLDGDDTGAASLVPLRATDGAPSAWRLASWLRHQADEDGSGPIAA